MIGHLNPGDRFRLPAEDFNLIADSANAWAASRPQASGRPLATFDSDRASCRILNQTGSAIPQFGVVELGTPVFSPPSQTTQSQADQFKQLVMFNGSIPSLGSLGTGRFAILQAPVPTGEIGIAVVAGVSVCQVEMASESHVVADINAGQVATLKSAESGVASLLWVQPIAQRLVANVAWALVRLGGGAAAPGIAIECGRVNATPTANVIQVRRMDASGNPTGSSFNIYAFAKDHLGTARASINLAQCAPKYSVGDPIRFARMRIRDGGTWIDDNWALDTFHWLCPAP